jgi:hypothetical protein
LYGVERGGCSQLVGFQYESPVKKHCKLQIG